MNAPRFPHGHHVGLWMSIDDDVPLLIGTARSADDVPELLQAIAARWSQRDSRGRLLDAGAEDTM